MLGVGDTKCGIYKPKLGIYTPRVMGRGTLVHSLGSMNLSPMIPFGYYYAHNPLVGPAFSPYVSTTSYGGYADIRFSDRFGSNIGVRRYINPMSGRWTTEPIVTPYIKVKKLRIEFPVGSLLKTLIWGDRDNPLRFQPRPMPTPQPKK